MLNGAGFPCIGLGANALHSRMPFQAFTGCGAFHLESPTGGAAKGTPLKIYMLPLLVPEINPASVLITSNVFIGFSNEVNTIVNKKMTPGILIEVIIHSAFAN
jgi:hypothetical protein